MQSINWQQFGLKGNPYDTLPLVEGGGFPIEKTFVGRVKEIEFLDGFFNSDNRGCLTICGEVGVGKTSLANFEKYLWKYEKTKALFSFRREIEASEELLNKKNFLIEIIGSILREINLTHPELMKDLLLMKINRIVDLSQDISFSGGISVLGSGIDGGKNQTTTQPIYFSVAMLESYFIKLVEFIKSTKIKERQYAGLIVHVNNFDVVLSDEKNKKLVIKFFNEIRDILQTPDVYFLFLGPKNLFKDIISAEQRVKGIFSQTPLLLNPLSKSEIVKAFNERMSILQSDDVEQYIKPVEDEVIFLLYDLYNGDIRSMMSAIKAILKQCSEKLAKKLSVNEAMLLLAEERWNLIEASVSLTTEQVNVLKYFTEKDGFITQKEIAEKFKKAQSNVSNYYFKPLRDACIIEEKSREGKMLFWDLTSHYKPLKWLKQSREKVNIEIMEKSEQLKLL